MFYTNYHDYCVHVTYFIISNVSVFDVVTNVTVTWYGFTNWNCRKTVGDG